MPTECISDLFGFAAVEGRRIAMASGCPYQHEFRDAHARLAAAAR